MTIAQLLVAIGADITPFEKQMKGLKKAIEPIAKDLEETGKSMTKYLTLPLAGAAAAIGALARATGEHAEALQMMATRTGLSVQSLQEMQYVAGQLDFSMESLQSNVLALSRRLLDVGAEGNDTGAAFRAMGIKVRDAHGQMVPMAVLFPQILDGLSKMQNETERNATATKIFGRQAAELTPLLNANKGEIAGLVARAHELGLVLGDDAVKAAADFDDKLTEVEMQFKAAGRELGTAFMPLLQNELIPFLQNKVIPGIRDVVQWFTKLPDTVKFAGVAILGLVALGGPMLVMFANLLRVLPAVITAFSALAAHPVLAALAIGVAILGARWVQYAVEQERAKAATAGMTAAMLEQSGTVNTLAKSQIPDLIAYYIGLAQAAQRAKDAIMAAHPETTPNPNQPNMKVRSGMTPEETMEIARQDLLLKGYAATLAALQAQWNAVGTSNKTLITPAANKALVDTAKSLVSVNTELAKVEPQMVAIGLSAERTFGDTMAEKINLFDDAMLTMGNGIENVTDALIAQVGEADASFGDLMKNFGNMARKMIAAEIAMGVAGAVRSALVGVPFPLNIILAGVAGAGAAALFSSIIPKFAQGGAVFGPTLAMVGDNPNAARDPEIIAPLSKLGGMAAQRIQVFGEFVARGTDLVLVINQTEENTARITG